MRTRPFRTLPGSFFSAEGATESRQTGFPVWRFFVPSSWSFTRVAVSGVCRQGRGSVRSWGPRVEAGQELALGGASSLVFVW